MDWREYSLATRRKLRPFVVSRMCMAKRALRANGERVSTLGRGRRLLRRYAGLTGRWWVA